MAEPKAVTTQRAYTLRLRGAKKDDQSWRDALWATHEAVNKGAKVFGDWLLTLRGGLCHTLADAKVTQGKDKPDRDPTPAERKDRRILLSLSWLSVESKTGAPSDCIVASGEDSPEIRNTKVIEAFRGILTSRSVSDVAAWVADCQQSLSAAIRNDAVWVNRSVAFDEACKGQDKTKARKDCQTLLCFLFTDDYLALGRKQAVKTKTPEGDVEPDDSEDAQRDELQGAAIKSGKGAGQRTRHPFSHIFGGKEDSKGFGKPVRKLELKNFWRDYLKGKLEDQALGCGIPLRDPKAKKKGEPPSPTELHREMFSKAASRLAQIHTKQKQQEVARDERQRADSELKALEDDSACHDALKLLETYGTERGVSTGAQGIFRIRPAAIQGWERIIEVWSRIVNGDATEDRRIEAVKTLQDEERDKKFGDISLFISLAGDEYKPVWFRNGNADSSILIKFVRGKKARADAERLKVAAYRHPDPYFNPVFCQFGVSRPRIEFRRLKDFTSKPEGKDVRAVGMLLWDGRKADLAVLVGASKRLDAEIGSACDSCKPGSSGWKTVTTRSRLGLAATNVKDGENARLDYVFDQKAIKSRTSADASENAAGAAEANDDSKQAQWNGSLRADRGSLKRIGTLLFSDGSKKCKAEGLKRRLKWWLTVSLELKPRGPWYDYINNSNNKQPFQRYVRKDESKGEKRKAGTAYISYDGWPYEERNKPLKEKPGDSGALVADKKNERLCRAKLILSRLPGLRLLSVDLGHRYAAACAVWQTLSKEEFDQECARAGPQNATIFPLYGAIKDPARQVKKISKTKKDNPNVATTYYRRIGPDQLDGQPHPAPWARLDRQFLIKLQGEERPVRAASANEMQLVGDFAKRHGLASDEERDKGRAVDELMARAVRNATLALKRHARHAKIAYAFDPATQSIPGMGDNKTDYEVYVKLLTDALFDWHALATESKWNDSFAREQWNKHIATMNGGWKIEEPQATAQSSAEKTRPQRRKDDDVLRERLKPLAQKLVKNDQPSIHQVWKERWEKDDGQPAKVDKPTGEKTANSSGIHADLRLLTDWIMGRRLPGATDKRWRKNVGGLSITRIATMKSLYQLQKAFAMRPRPDKPCGAPEKGETNAGVAQSILNAMERMREQRVKQLASRIAEAALGIGREKISAKGKDPKRPRERVYQPCHAVVIENLTNYRPDELQTRRENRQLMDWSSGKVKKYLGEACQLHGLHLREVSPDYTSRQDSRTGAPGMRCADITVREFMQSPLWRKQVAQAEKKQDRSAREQLLCELAGQLKGKEAEWRGERLLRIPRKGGELFVSANEKSPAAKGLQADLNAAANIGPPRRTCRLAASALQADLNAAANIGLKALLDPDWTGAWWYVPCESHVPLSDTVKGCPLFDARTLPVPSTNVIVPPVVSVPTAAATKERKRGGRRTSGDADASARKTSLWRDPGAESLYDSSRQWLPKPQYWKCVEERVINVLKQRHNLLDVSEWVVLLGKRNCQKLKKASHKTADSLGSKNSQPGSGGLTNGFGTCGVRLNVIFCAGGEKCDGSGPGFRHDS